MVGRDVKLKREVEGFVILNLYNAVLQSEIRVKGELSFINKELPHFRSVRGVRNILLFGAYRSYAAL